MISYPNYKSGLRLEIFILEGKQKTENTYFPFRAFFIGSNTNTDNFANQCQAI